MAMTRFQLRRRRLARRHLCTKCGESPARRGHCECAPCALIKSLKAEQRRELDRAAAAAMRRASLESKAAALERAALDLRAKAEKIPA